MPTVTDPSIPAPDGAREVLKTNVFERMISANTSPLPLFPYYGPGAVLVAAALTNGGPDGLGTAPGTFHHRNSQHEVSVLYGCSRVPFTPGRIAVNEETHGNGGYFTVDSSPDEVVLLTLTQRQRDDDDPQPQREAIRFRCPDCDELLLDFDYDAAPGARPRHGSDEPGGRPQDRIPLFPTVWGVATAAMRFAADEDLRTCAACGRVADPFPYASWGWATWVGQHRASNLALDSLLAAAAGATPRGATA